MRRLERLFSANHAAKLDDAANMSYIHSTKYGEWLYISINYPTGRGLPGNRIKSPLCWPKHGTGREGFGVRWKVWDSICRQKANPEPSIVSGGV